ncbi:MAG TPA: DUF2252 domain-containing protein [Micromonosporaceae bacterium]|nr:DUF2252 domain-containing protein [Micromonosporaceae bacterium]
MAAPTTEHPAEPASPPATGPAHVPASRAERDEAGRAARKQVPLAEHARLPEGLRADPVGLLEEQATTRVPELVPIRYGRMLASPFAFYRGAALVMAHDLAQTPTTGLRVQTCGDAHLLNFGLFGSPERRLVFDLNDFDETLPGPFDWDVKRLAASVAIAGRAAGIGGKRRRAAVVATVAAYRQAMRQFAETGTLAVWYARADVEELKAVLAKEFSQRATDRALARAKTRDGQRSFSKLVRHVGGEPRIVSAPPLIVPIEDLLPEHDADALLDTLTGVLRGYRRTLQPDRRHLLDQYRLVHVARKVVGVGSVGTRAWVLLLMDTDRSEPLFLQAKEAQTAVHARFAGRSAHANQGQRVVLGQRLMQAASDIFLGWQRTTGVDGVQRDFYVRQLSDWKASIAVEALTAPTLTSYGKMCGWTLARAHARSGDRIAIAAYLGSSDRFDQAVAEFSEAYADLNDADHGALRAAVKSGRVTAETGV